MAWSPSWATEVSRESGAGQVPGTLSVPNRCSADRRVPTPSNHSLVSLLCTPQNTVLGPRSFWQFDNGALALQMDVRLPAAPLATATVARGVSKKI